MEKPTFSRIAIIGSFLLFALQSIAQNHVPFTPRFNQDLKGDIVLIGNNILGPSNDAFNNNTSYNHTVDMRYIDIDGDASTFSSSSADLNIPNPNCYQIKYAGLYWGAVTKGEQPITDIKFKGPTGGYNDIVGTIVYNADGTPTGDSFPYSCYADVTDIVTGLSNDLGTYTVGNISSAEGATAFMTPYNGTGYSAGWSLFVVYEDPTLPGKSITSFDGFSAISSSVNVDVPISGFRTVPAPAPVRANFAFAALEGDKPIENDRLVLNGVPLSAADRPANNFFNSSVTQLSALPVDNRNPNSTNTLGFDTGVMVVPNPSNNVIANDATSATVRLESNQDVYFQYFFAFAVEIIEPNIVLTKIVEDDLGNNIGGQTIGLAQSLNYVIGFQNTGNDNATNFQIRDILPINIVFDYPSDLILPAGVTVSSYNPATRELIFDIEDYLVEENDPAYEIRIEVMTVETCSQLADACSNIINNQAYARYNGSLNPNFEITDDPSFSSNTGCLISPQATNFLADLDDCTFEETITLCGDTVELTAANGYDSYSWSTSITGTPVIGTGQSITVTETGNYYVYNTAIAPCQSIVQSYDVTLFGSNTSNPVIPYADEVVICPNDGKELPLLFLCGANDSVNIETNISSASSIIWEVLDESSCSAVPNQDCANEDTGCTWNEVGTGPNYLANTAGQYRLTINYSGGCFLQFYFNVYQNLLSPTVSASDIICTTPGNITVGGVPSGYQYSIDGVNYQSSNSFTVDTPGNYTVYIQQEGVETNPCVFTVPDVQVRSRDFTVSAIINQPLCHGDKGSVHLAANDADPQYFFELYNGGTLVNSVGPNTQNSYTFENLNPGTYTATVETEDGCTHTEDFTIVDPPLLLATAALTVPLSCNDGEITVYPTGGTPPYFYFVNSGTDFQTVPEIVITESGVYNITVVDSNNCTATAAVTVIDVPAPNYNIISTNIECNGNLNSGAIIVDIPDASGTTLLYSIDGGVTFTNSPVFTGLSAGDYSIVVQYSVGGVVCLTEPQTVTISAAVAIEGTVSLTAPYTCSANGEITVTDVSGGTEPYTYSIDGTTFQSGNNFTDLTNGTYSVIVQDSNGCTSMVDEITILPLDPPTDLTFSSSALTCPTNVSTITITGTIGGTDPLEYQIIAPSSVSTGYQASPEFSGLESGTYTFQVKDANNCTYSESYTISPLAPITVVGQNINDVTCFGAGDGSVQFTVSGTTDFNYTINGGASTSGSSPIVLTGLSEVTYTITVTDANTNCEATASLTVNGPASVLAMTVDVTQITCEQNGSVIVNATGGWGGNTYSLTLPDGSVLPAQSSNTFVNLTQEGTYTVTAVDANNCTVTETFILNTSDLPVAVVDTTSDLCYDGINGATIEVTVTSGQAPFEYSVNGGAYQSNSTFSNLVPATYTVTVRDANGCTVTLSAQTISEQITLNTVLTKDLDCSVAPDAIITGTVTGGTAPFTYEVSINGGAYSALGATGSPFTYTTATPGTYQLQISGAQGCTAESGIITINPISPPALSLVAQTQPILCNGDTNGAIEITIDNTVGTAPFVINVNNDTTGTDFGTQTSGLPAGTYTVTLTDANLCTATDTVTIDQPDPIIVDFHTVDISCTSSGISQGSIIIDGVTGGTAPYNYFVTGTNGYSNSELNSSGSTSVTFDVVDFGLYQINVVDASGCSVLFQDVLVASPPTDLDINIATTVDCLSGGEAVVSIGSTLTSAGPFFFSIYQGPISVYPNPAGSWIPEDAAGSQSATFTGLTPGVLYTFIVYDASTNCSYYEPATAPVPTNSSLTATAVSANNITCTGNADGTVSFTVNSVYGTATTISYEVFDSLSMMSSGVSGTGVVPANGSLTVSDLGALPYGNYYVLISETSGSNSGCSVVTVPFNITESAIPLSLTVSVDQNANCNSNSGVISAIGHDGTSPYQYQITTTATAPSANDAQWASASTFNLDAGNYYVHVVDAYGCVVSSPVVLLPMDAIPVVAADVDNQCDTVEGNFEIYVTLTTTGISPHSYSIDGGAFQMQTAPFTISNVSSGSHTVEVQDANGCGNLVTVIIETPIGLTPSITALPSCSDDDGTITVTGVGGSGTYAYSISPNPASVSVSGNVFSGVPSGVYTVTMTDTVTSCAETVSVTLDAATPVDFTAASTDVTCNGGNNGTITVDLPSSNDNPVYTYEIIAPIVLPAQNSNVFTGLSAETYTVRVTSGRGCVATEAVVIGEPQVLEVSGTATDFACALDNSVNTSTITITEIGGIAPYTYSIDGTNYFTTNTFDVIDDGSIQSITIYVKDANGCLDSDTLIINPLPSLSLATATIATPIDCNDTGSVSISVTGGSGNFTYQMLPSGAPQSSNVFNITGPGDYYFQVNDTDTGCNISTAAITIAPYNTIEAVLIATASVTCFGESNGELEWTVSEFTGNYNYEVFNTAGTSVTGSVAANTATNPQIIAGLSAGNYTIVLTETDTPFCSTTTNVVTVGSPSETLALDLTESSNVTCSDDQGTITAVATGGWGGVEYELTGASTVGYSSNGTFTGLSAGTYTVNAMDSGGCIASGTITLEVPLPIDATFTASTGTLLCFGDQDASITVSNVSGGQGSNYTYTLNTVLPTASTSGPQTLNVFTDLAAGTYSVVINDGYGCSRTSADIVIGAPTPITASLVTATAQTCLIDAELTLSASGGTGAYQYSDDSGFATVLGTFTASATFDVAPGTYSYYVRDANGCVATVSNEITIEQIPALELELELVNATINCAGDNTGAIIATATGGLGDYVYILQDGSGVEITDAVQNSPGVFTGLVAGDYIVLVESGDCSDGSLPVSITEPDAPLEVSFEVSNISCPGTNNGAVEITATGGTGTVQYAISPQLNQFFSTNTFVDLSPGTYDVIVQDQLGCYVTFDFTVTEPAPVILGIVADSFFPEVCFGEANGEFSVEISGGVKPYSVSLDDYNGVYTQGSATQAQFDFTDLVGGDHVVFVRDSNGCESEWNISFPESVRIEAEVEVSFSCDNNNAVNAVTVMVDGTLTDTAELDYSLDGGPYQMSNVFTDVPTGTDHYVDVRHTNGCIVTTKFFEIPEFEPLALVLEEGELNEIVAVATGGTGDYEFWLNGESQGDNNVFTIYETGTYNITVTDGSSCERSAAMEYEFVDICIPNYFTPNGDGIQDGWAPGCSNGYPNLEFDIFDRYGRKVASLRQGELWDGRYNGNELPTGDYWYVVSPNSTTSDREFVGNFTLYR
ncbi:T9SS type B sorting domain-containing protein [Sediminibacter sp. Hel_I_10]|uniref:T9SS type B sorting domain-containing protein n=1 Tax=Sediminibacter sp. Hel_I_10 TaxID=1392490 RepID=UPI00069246EF|nr:T9SS type B sorting domain-containing protein [Sediminibacter sp. Hel_I_10]